MVTLRYTEPCPKPRSYDILLMHIASSMSYPVYEMTATTAFAPFGYSSRAYSSYERLRTIGDCGVCSLYTFVSTRCG